MKKFFILFVCGLFVLAIGIGGVGCGGGGGSSTSTTTDGGLSPIRAEAALAGNPDAPIDPLNLQAGEAVVFQVVGYDVNRQRHILASASWTTTDNGNQAGVLQPDGNFGATASSGATFYTASGIANGTTYNETYRVKPVQSLVTGTIVDSNGFGASHVSIVFYNASNVEVSRGYAQFDGSFRVSTPTSATRFFLDKATMPKQFYYRSWVYQTLRYTALDTTCNAALPALTNGVTTAIGTITVDAAETNGNPNPPPPPPTGCPI